MDGVGFLFFVNERFHFGLFLDFLFASFVISGVKLLFLDMNNSSRAAISFSFSAYASYIVQRFAVSEKVFIAGGLHCSAVFYEFKMY